MSNRQTNTAAATGPARAYPDLHDHIATLEKEGLLVRVDRPIDKDTGKVAAWLASGASAPRLCICRVTVRVSVSTRSASDAASGPVRRRTRKW